jgi:hypothetical protein
MKKLSAILLIGMLFFNWYGYRLLTAWQQQRADRRLEARIDNEEYDESNILWIRIPVTSISYYNGSTEFERIDGQIIFGGVAYRYVKRRIFMDSVELMCVRNTDATSLGQTSNEFFRLVNNLTHFPGSKTTGSIDPQKVFSFDGTDYTLAAPDRVAVSPIGFLIPDLPPGHGRLYERPPEGLLHTT